MNHDHQKCAVLPALGASGCINNVIIGIGASTGGTEAILEVLRRLPEDTPGIVVVQHMPPDGDFTAKYAQRLDELCRMEVREAKHGDEIRRGRAYIAPANFHTRVVKSNCTYALMCSQEERYNMHRPSVDVLFHSMAENVKCKMAGIILTGMGNDGARGLLAMRQRGAYTIGQDEGSSVVYGMPMEAQKIGAVYMQAPCQHIAGILYQYLKKL